MIEAQQREQRQQHQWMPCASCGSCLTPARGSTSQAEFPSACSQPDTANLGPGDPSPRETFRPQGAESVLRWQILASSLPSARCLFAQPVAEADQPYSLPDMSYSQLSRLESKYIEVLHIKNPILDLTELHLMVLHIAENGPDWSTQTCLVALVCAIAVLSEPYPGTVMRSGAQSTPSLHQDDASGADDKLSLQFWNISLKRLGYAMRENSVEAVQSLVLAGIWYMHRMERTPGSLETLQPRWRSLEHPEVNSISTLGSQTQ